MVTKDQERKALAQIRKIVEGLGEGSYLSFAFEGCWEKAEENIENDFACSMKQEVTALEERIEKQAKDIELLTHQKEFLSGKLETAEKDAKKYFQDALSRTQTIHQMEEDYAKMQKENDALADEVKCLKEDYADQIIRLKARLFDLMDK